MQDLKPEIKAIYDELSDQQKTFLSNYLSNGYNGTQAALVAGYSANSACEQGSRLLSSAKIKIIKDSIIDCSAIRHQLTHDHLVEAAKELLDMTKDQYKSTGTGASDVKGAIEVAAKLVGANAPDKSHIKQDSTLIISQDEELLKKRIEAAEKDL